MCARSLAAAVLAGSQDVSLRKKGLPFHLSLENQSGGKRNPREEVIRERHFVGFYLTCVMGTKLAVEA